MIFNSLFNLIENDTDGVYKFMCRFFYEYCDELCIADRLYLFAMLKIFKDEKEKNDEQFIKLFQNKKGLLKIFSNLTGDGEVNFFTNSKDIKYSALSENQLKLACIYVKIFDISNIKNPEEDFCKKVKTVQG